jgi:all-trans-8'-apo-beta-carotenal 15,15'-oxygenase
MATTIGPPHTLSGVNPVLHPAIEVPGEVVLDVTGRIPAQLRGTLYRNGPGRWEAGGFVAQHAFDGDGLVSKFTIEDGTVRFRSRYVRTPKFLAEQAGHGDRVRGVGNQRRGGMPGNAGRIPAGSANTHAVLHAGRLLALSDAGRPFELAPGDLSTRGACDFDGTLPPLSRFSPHPRTDPVSGELFNFGLDLVPRAPWKLPAGLRCYRIDPAGHLSTIATVPLDHLYIQHDFAITEHYLVFVLAPIIASPVRTALGLGTAENAVSYRTDVGTKIVLVPRSGGRPRQIECPPLMYIHINNAFEDRGDVVVDLIRYNDYGEFFGPVREFRTTTGTLGGFASRLRVTAGDRVLVEDFSDQRTELPQHDIRRTSRPYRYGYHTTLTLDAADTPRIVKIDTDTGCHREHPFTPGDAVGEPIFVPRSAAAAEDDGWLLTVVHLAAEHRSALVILDAHDPERAPIAVAKTDHHFFPGFHGSFTTHISDATA